MSERQRRNGDSSFQLVASQGALDAFHESVASLWCPNTIVSIHNLDENNVLSFVRNHVAKSRPCILRTENNNLPGWKVDDVRHLCGENHEITVNVTPNGHGDAIRDGVFVLPEERTMKLGDFCTALQRAKPVMAEEKNELVIVNELQGMQGNNPEAEASIDGNIAKPSLGVPGDGVYYYSMQNDCLRSEFAPLVPHVDATQLLQFAQESFGTGPPDAVNLWMGNEHAHSSLHKDYYENLFYVASGEKIFTLYPPADAAVLPQRDYPTSRHVYNNEDNTWNMVSEEDPTRWIDVESASADLLHPLTVHVQAGDILYLPSLWFHAVTQTCETVAINWWFDMHFDSPLYCYFTLLESCRLLERSDDNNDES